MDTTKKQPLFDLGLLDLQETQVSKTRSEEAGPYEWWVWPTKADRPVLAQKATDGRVLLFGVRVAPPCDECEAA